MLCLGGRATERRLSFMYHFIGCWSDSTGEKWAVAVSLAVPLLGQSRNRIQKRSRETRAPLRAFYARVKQREISIARESADKLNLTDPLCLDVGLPDHLQQPPLTSDLFLVLDHGPLKNSEYFLGGGGQPFADKLSKALHRNHHCRFTFADELQALAA